MRKFLTTDRRTFLAASAATMLLPRCGVHAAGGEKVSAESLAGELYAGLSESQRRVVCLPLSDASMTKAHANWHITQPLIGSDFYTDSQQSLIAEIVKHVTSEEGYERISRQMDDDDGGVGAYSMALFGHPGGDAFQWVLTGRHLTLRADGDTLRQSAFGGPLVYGHGEESSPRDNLFYYQTQQVNKVFESLDAAQREQAMIGQLPGESQLKPNSGSGIAAGQLDEGQKQLLRESIKTVLSPYRQGDGDEAMRYIDQAGFDQLRLMFARAGDLEGDGIWDMWRIESPAGVIHFRGAPHVHAYIHFYGPNA